MIDRTDLPDLDERLERAETLLRIYADRAGCLSERLDRLDRAVAALTAAANGAVPECPACSALHAKQFWICERPRGHEGPHAALMHSAPVQWDDPTPSEC